MELLDLYRRMATARAVEVALGDLWERGKISGEMHLGTGEEAVAAAVTAHLTEGDAVALDHRPTPVLALLGVDLRAMIAECMGREDGLGRGCGGHMHLFSRPHLAASSGIVGAAAPTAVGFALAATRLRPGKISVAFFGEGAMNQGAVLESLNLASVWSLPVVFVCKDNGWAVSTRSSSVTAGDLVRRARAFGWHADRADGLDAMETWRVAGRCIEHARRGRGPAFLLARCSRLDGHFCGDPMLRVTREPGEAAEVLRGVVRSVMERGGAGPTERVASMGRVTALLARARAPHQGGRADPLTRARRSLGVAMADEVRRIDEAASRRVAAVVQSLEGPGAP